MLPTVPLMSELFYAFFLVFIGGIFTLLLVGQNND
jgi:hypothetical protein